jgi:hypothetical protein
MNLDPKPRVELTTSEADKPPMGGGKSERRKSRPKQPARTIPFIIWSV